MERDPGTVPATDPSEDPDPGLDPSRYAGGAAEDGEQGPQLDEHRYPTYRDSSLWRWRGPVSLAGGILFAVLGWLLVAGALAYQGDDALASARPADLVTILDSLEADNNRLEQEARGLQSELDSLRSGSSAEALRVARAREQSLQVLAGTTPVTGPGVRIVIRDPDGGVSAGDILGAVQELRDAGAESIEVAQRRVVVDTWFADPAEGQAGILVSGDLRGSPYTILAVGDPQTLATAMEIPGGVAETARTDGAEISIERRDSLVIESTVPLERPRYAEPAEQ